MSRGGPPWNEWGLSPHISQLVWHRFGCPVADLFASAENALCPLWFSLRSADAPPLGVDALAHDTWPQGLLYAFPPVHLLPLMLRRVRSMALHILVVAPDSPRTMWFPDLIQMSVEVPWPLPDVADALWQAGGTLRSRPVLSGRLLVWKLNERGS